MRRNQDLKHLRGARKVIFLDQFESSPGSHRGSQRECLSLANFAKALHRDAQNATGCNKFATDPPVLPPAGSNQPGRMSYADQVNQLISRINAIPESVSLGQPARVTSGIRMESCQEIKLKSLILAQPERWRRG